jgi:hypothetical protein
MGANSIVLLLLWLPNLPYPTCVVVRWTSFPVRIYPWDVGNSKGIRRYHVGPFTCADDKALMLFNVQNGSTVYTHRTGSQSITNVDEYPRALTHGTSGYGSIYYAKANRVSYSQHKNRYYIIAVMPLSGGGGGM